MSELAGQEMGRHFPKLLFRLRPGGTDVNVTIALLLDYDVYRLPLQLRVK